MFRGYSDAEIRELCRTKIESLEFWLRRLIHDLLSPKYGDYFEGKFEGSDDWLINRKTVKMLNGRMAADPVRYPRKVDAIDLDDAMNIICNEELYRIHFRPAFAPEFPQGREALKTTFDRIVDARNPLSHANAISLRSAERVVCYSNDVIDSLKRFYRENAMGSQYDVPLIIKVADSFGNVFAQEKRDSPEGRMTIFLDEDPRFFLRPGDVLTIEIEVDPSYSPYDYEIQWYPSKGGTPVDTWNRPKIEIMIENAHVGTRFAVNCLIVAKREWHRFDNADDQLLIFYRVLPATR